MSTEYTKTNWQDGDIITADKMNNIENGVKGIEGELSTVKDGLGISSASISASASGNQYLTYAIEAGKKYTFKVESSLNCSIATVNASNQTIESVGTLMNGNSLVFTATQDAPKVLFYFRASGTGSVTSENAIDAIEGQIAELNDDLIKAVGHISASVTASGSGNNYVTYAIKAGETYKFTVSSTANCSLATVSESNQTIENVGALMNGSLQFTATQDAPKVLFYFRASGTGSVSTINELDGIIELANTKYAKEWMGKTWANYGDSISWLYDWHSYVNNLLGFSGFIRNGKPGAPISWTNTTFGIDANGIYTTSTPVKTVHDSMCSYERISETLDNTLPLIFVMGGTNDFLSNVPLGDLTFNSTDTTDGVWHTANAVGDYNISTFKGAMASMLMKLQYYAPNALIVFGTLLNGIGATTGENQYTEQVNTVNLKPSDYAKAEKEVCEVFGVPYVDVFANCGINITNRAAYISDTVHPNTAGMKLLARCVAKGLMTEFLRLT